MSVLSMQEADEKLNELKNYLTCAMVILMLLGSTKASKNELIEKARVKVLDVIEAVETIKPEEAV